MIESRKMKIYMRTTIFETTTNALKTMTRRLKDVGKTKMIRKDGKMKMLRI